MKADKCGGTGYDMSMCRCEVLFGKGGSAEKSGSEVCSVVLAEVLSKVSRLASWSGRAQDSFRSFIPLSGTLSLFFK